MTFFIKCNPQEEKIMSMKMINYNTSQMCGGKEKSREKKV